LVTVVMFSKQQLKTGRNQIRQDLYANMYDKAKRPINEAFVQNLMTLYQVPREDVIYALKVIDGFTTEQVKAYLPYYGVKAKVDVKLYGINLWSW